MKLGSMKSQLPWSLEQADLAFCHSGGLGWDAAEVLAPMGAKARVAGTIDELVRAGRAGGAARRPHPVHEQRRRSAASTPSCCRPSQPRRHGYGGAAD